MQHTLEDYTYTLEQYRDTFFNGNQAAMMRYWGKKRQEWDDWKKAKSIFIVIGNDHIRSQEKNAITFEEGVK